MYIFNRITVNPQLPKRIGRINEIANNLWWSWNTEFLRLFKMIDIDLWESCRDSLQFPFALYPIFPNVNILHYQGAFTGQSVHLSELKESDFSHHAS